MGDFLGFTFGDVHSSYLGITRVSGGDRYDEQLHPEIKDRTAEVPGVNGNYYFGSDFGPKQFDIEIAYDHLTEEQFRKLRRAFGTKHIQQLIFDERPYKYYMAKIMNPIELSYVCFDEQKKDIGATREGVRVTNRIPITEEVDGEEQIIGYTIERELVTPYEYQEGTERIYKGEGKISFICYFPFAKSKFTQLPNGLEGDWVSSSGILSQEQRQQNNIDVYHLLNNGSNGFVTYNPGDFSTGFRLYCPFSTTHSLSLIYQEESGVNSAFLNITDITPQGQDTGFIIDTNVGLIYGTTGAPQERSDGVIDLNTSNNIYNQYIVSGHFFKLEPNTETNPFSKIIIKDINSNSIPIENSNIQIFYDYLYF